MSDAAPASGPDDEKLPMSVARRGDWVVLRPKEAGLMDPVVIDLLGDRLKALVAGGEANLILDFKHVQYISSSMIGTLVAARTAALGAGGKMALAGLNDRLAQLLKITRLDKMFDVYPDARAALEAVGAT